MKKPALRKFVGILALVLSIPLLSVAAEDGLAQGADLSERFDISLKREILEVALSEVSLSPQPGLVTRRESSESLTASENFQRFSRKTLIRPLV